jgi:hypothetical protein
VVKAIVEHMKMAPGKSNDLALREGSDPYPVRLHLPVHKKHVSDNGTTIERIVERVVVIESFQLSVQVGYIKGRMLHISKTVAGPRLLAKANMAALRPLSMSAFCSNTPRNVPVSWRGVLLSEEPGSTMSP